MCPSPSNFSCSPLWPEVKVRMDWDFWLAFCLSMLLCHYFIISKVATKLQSNPNQTISKPSKSMNYMCICVPHPTTIITIKSNLSFSCFGFPAAVCTYCFYKNLHFKLNLGLYHVDQAILTPKAHALVIRCWHINNSVFVTIKKLWLKSYWL